MYISKDLFLYQVTLSIKRYASVGVAAAIVFTLLFFAVGGIAQLARIFPNLQIDFSIYSFIVGVCFASTVVWIVNIVLDRNGAGFIRIVLILAVLALLIYNGYDIGKMISNLQESVKVAINDHLTSFGMGIVFVSLYNWIFHRHVYHGHYYDHPYKHYDYAHKHSVNGDAEVSSNAAAGGENPQRVNKL